MANNPYVNKVQKADGTVIIDISDTTATAESILAGYGAYGADGAWIDGTATSGGGGGVIITDETDEHGGTIRTITAIEVTGTKTITSNGTGIDVTNYAAVNVSVPQGGGGNYQSKSATPTESELTILPDDGYDALSSVTVGAISSSYVGSGIARKSSSNLSASGATVTAPAGYYAEDATKSVANGTVTAPASISGTSSTVSTGTNTLTLTKTISVTPSVTTAGYVSSGTAGNSEVSLTASVNTRSSSSLSADGATVTAPAGYYASDATKSVSTMTLPTAATSSATSGYTSKATISRSTSDQYINIPTGYNTAGAYYKVSAVANGSATAPASITGTSANVSTGTNTLTLSKTVSVTPSVTTGYVSSGTAGNSNVSLTASVTTKAAATYYPSTSDQEIAASQYLTGKQTIKGVVVSGLAANKILSGTTVKIGDSADDDRITSVSGSVAFQTYYTGSSAPSGSLGVNGDIYLKTS